MCAAGDLLVQTLADECGPRLPVTDLGLERIPFRRSDVRRVRNNEVPPLLDRFEPCLVQIDGEVECFGVLAREGKRLRRGVDSRNARTRMLVGNRERVSGLGTSARASVFKVRCLNPQCPRTYASGSRRARRSTNSCRPPGTSRSRSTWSCDRVTPRTCATSSSASTCGVSTPAAPRRSSASRSASATVTRRARACALRRRALR